MPLKTLTPPRKAPRTRPTVVSTIGEALSAAKTRHGHRPNAAPPNKDRSKSDRRVTADFFLVRSVTKSPPVEVAWLYAFSSIRPGAGQSVLIERDITATHAVATLPVQMRGLRCRRGVRTKNTSYRTMAPR